MEQVLFFSVLSTLAAITLVSGACVEDESTALKSCFDPLKAEVNKISGSDIKGVEKLLCGSQKSLVECIIKKFKMCPEFKNETFMDELQHTKSGFHVKEFFYVNSADSYCKCAPTFECLDKVEADKMEMKSKRSWNKMPNLEYMCKSSAKVHLDCVEKALPECDTYLQYKYNQKDGSKKLDVTNIEHAAMFASKHCGENQDVYKTYTCMNKTGDWYAMGQCFKSAQLYSNDEDKSCGLRKCVEINMGWCPAEEMNYYIEAVNVYSMYKIDKKPCTLTSSATSLLATVSTILLATYLSLAL